MFKWIKSLFNQSSYQKQLDDYVKSHNPTNTYDVERLVKQYERASFWGIYGRQN